MRDVACRVPCMDPLRVRSVWHAPRRPSHIRGASRGDATSKPHTSRDGGGRVVFEIGAISGATTTTQRPSGGGRRPRVVGRSLERVKLVGIMKK